MTVVSPNRSSEGENPAYGPLLVTGAPLEFADVPLVAFPLPMLGVPTLDTLEVPLPIMPPAAVALESAVTETVTSYSPEPHFAHSPGRKSGPVLRRWT